MSAQTPDRFPGALGEEEVVFEEQSTDPTVDGALRYVNGDFKGKDGTGVFNLRSGSGLTETQHRALRQLIHFIDEGPAEGFLTGAYREVTGGLFPTAVIWYDQQGEGKKKIVEQLITWSGVLPSAIVWKVYDSSEVLLATVTDSPTYSGIFETSRTREIVVS